jgi:hypothetical protein
MMRAPGAGCAAPLCEGPTPCRGRRPHHARIGCHFRGSIPHPTRLLCTLRDRRCRRPRNTRYQAACYGLTWIGLSPTRPRQLALAHRQRDSTTGLTHPSRCESDPLTGVTIAPETLPDDPAALKRIIAAMVQDALNAQAEIAKLKFPSPHFSRRGNFGGQPALVWARACEQSRGCS